MVITKFEIYSFWKDKAITNKFKVKNYAECRANEEALPILEFYDDICCWACGLPSWIIGNENICEADDLKKEWNNDKSLQKAHILANSLGGLETANNLFLLCPTCHAESPDTRENDDFFAWVYYKRKNENYITTIYRELERACKMKNIDSQIVQDYFSKVNYEKLMSLRRRIIKNCTVHGSFVSSSSKMMALLSEVMKDVEHEES